jgi:hypothetical protein
MFIFIKQRMVVDNVPFVWRKRSWPGMFIEKGQALQFNVKNKRKTLYTSLNHQPR